MEECKIYYQQNLKGIKSKCYQSEGIIYFDEPYIEYAKNIIKTRQYNVLTSTLYFNNKPQYKLQLSLVNFDRYISIYSINPQNNSFIKTNQRCKLPEGLLVVPSNYRMSMS